MGERDTHFRMNRFWLDELWETIYNPFDTNTCYSLSRVRMHSNTFFSRQRRSENELWSGHKFVEWKVKCLCLVCGKGVKIAALKVTRKGFLFSLLLVLFLYFHLFSHPLRCLSSPFPDRMSRETFCNRLKAIITGCKKLVCSFLPSFQRMAEGWEQSKGNTKKKRRRQTDGVRRVLSFLASSSFSRDPKLWFFLFLLNYLDLKSDPNEEGERITHFCALATFPLSFVRQKKSPTSDGRRIAEREVGFRKGEERVPLNYFSLKSLFVLDFVNLQMESLFTLKLLVCSQQQQEKSSSLSLSLSLSLSRVGPRFDHHDPSLLIFVLSFSL